MRLTRIKHSVPARATTGIPHRSRDTSTALQRYLAYGVLPAWFVPGLLDWCQHRRTDIEHTAGTRESFIHLLIIRRRHHRA
jgi:hypothetical protein